MRKLASWMWVSIAALVAPHAAAQGCGAVLTSSVSLTADVVCGPGQDGLIVAASGVKIDLNGFSVIGPWTSTGGGSSATGIRASGVDAVTIRGPGRIEGFMTPIEIDGGVAHTIRGVAAIAHWGNPTTLRNASLSLIEASEITRLALVADPGFDARENRIVRNRVGGLPSGGGIWLYGCGAFSNQVYANRNDGHAVAIGLFQGANNNRVQGNRIKNGSIALIGASRNTIVNNRIENPPTENGMDLEDSWSPSTCGGSASMDNRIIANQIIGGQIGVYLRQYSAVPSHGRNLISDNTFADLTYSALYFDNATFDNDARYNNYTNIAVIAYDFGVGNLWP
jgi:hypothetical protein